LFPAFPGFVNNLHVGWLLTSQCWTASSSEGTQR